MLDAEIYGLVPGYQSYTIGRLILCPIPTLMKLLFRLPPVPVCSGIRHALNQAFVLSGLVGCMLAAPVFANESAEVSKLLRAGQLVEAMAKVDAFLAQRPRDAQMRFLKGVILTEQNKSPEAIAVFTKLTEDFPDLPEPYNNLAVLYAASGQYDKARAALDTAIRTNPSYATAYENLGDVHAKLASQAYDKALQLDSSNSAAKSKLVLLRSLSANGSGVNVAAATKAVASATAEAPKAAVPVVTKAAAPVAQQPTSKVLAAAPVKPTPAASVAVKPEAKPVKPGREIEADHDAVLAVINNWAKAWSARDVKAYLGFYAGDFQTPNGESRAAWAEERRARIVGKGRISVKIAAPVLAVNGNVATVKFRQTYVSDRLKADSRKTLVLAKHGGKWQIRQEHAGS